jgi:hypothetical protein
LPVLLKALLVPRRSVSGKGMPVSGRHTWRLRPEKPFSGVEKGFSGVENGSQHVRRASQALRMILNR